VLETLNRKLVRRHPHVFGEAASAAAGNEAVVDAAVDGSAARVLANWEQIKVAEKRKAGGSEKAESLLDGVQRAQPALLEAAKLGSKAAKVGFDWPEWRGLLAKVEEETAELVEAVERRGSGIREQGIKIREQGTGNREKGIEGDGEKEIPFGNDNQENAVESELGDLLFTVVNLGRHLGVDGEMALRGTNARFRRRFGWMEKAAGKPLAELSADELEGLWREAKVDLGKV